ncbi:MAG: hypothetical protein ABUT20_57305 [Bacteroidota bacterium]
MSNNLNNPVSLRFIIAELLSCYKKDHPDRASFIVNSVSKDVVVYPGKGWLAPVICDLHALLSETQVGEMTFIDAKIENDETILYILKRQKIESTATIQPERLSLPTFSIFPTRNFFGSYN